MTPEERKELMTQVFIVRSPCGRTYEVPLRKVLNDYVDFRLQADGDSRAKVISEISPSDVEVWFYEQYNWQDVERDGKIVGHPTAAQVEEALNLMRGSEDPSNVAELRVSSAAHARIKRAQLRGSVSQGVPRASTTRGPRSL